VIDERGYWNAACFFSACSIKLSAPIFVSIMPHILPFVKQVGLRSGAEGT